MSKKYRLAIFHIVNADVRASERDFLLILNHIINYCFTTLNAKNVPRVKCAEALQQQFRNMKFYSREMNKNGFFLLLKCV